jgi:hypothetical protein
MIKKKFFKCSYPEILAKMSFFCLIFQQMLDKLPDDDLKGSLSNAPVAQLDRVPDYESVGRRFESCQARL